MGRQFRAQPVDEFRIHEAVIVRNRERHQWLVFQLVGKTGVQAIGVAAFHAKNDVGLADVTIGDFSAGTIFRPGGAGLIARMILEERFRCWTAPLVARADK